MGRNTSDEQLATQGKCVFCGCTDLSETQIWPSWLDQIIPASSYQRLDGDTGRLVCEQNAATPKTRSDLRAPLAQRPRLACATCNSGWISKLGADVRQFLVPALTGGSVDLAPDQAKALSGWLCLLGMNAAFLTRHCGISAGDRSFLRHTGQPPKDWSIFVAGLSEEGWSKACTHHPYRIEFSGNPMTTHSKTQPIKDCNTQLLSFGMGPLFFHIFGSPSLLLQHEFAQSSKGRGLSQLWPLERRFGVLPLRHVTIPPKTKLTDEQAWEITDMFADLLRHRVPTARPQAASALASVA